MLKRVLCVVIGHNYVAARYQGSGDDGGRYLHCVRCRHDKEVLGPTQRGFIG